RDPATLVSRKKESNTPSVTGVKAIVLRSDVAMHLWVDSRSGFLGGNSPKKPESAAGKNANDKPATDPKKDAPPAEKVQVVIKTQGPFVYDVFTDHARFDISQHPGPHPNNVEVSRQQRADAWDQLICDHLELQFSRKPPIPAGARKPDQAN